MDDNPPFLPRTLLHVGWRYLLRRPWQSALMVVGIMLGVAVVVAIDLANASASRAFDLSTAAVAGRATHQIVGGPAGLDEAHYTALRREGVVTATTPGVAAAPVVSAYVTSPALGDRPLQLLGVDPFAEAPFRSYLAGEDGVPVAGLSTFLARPGAVLLSTDLAARYGLQQGDVLTLNVGAQARAAFIAGLIEPGDSLSRRALEGVILADIATAQELTGRVGRLDRFDLILPEDAARAETVRARIEALLPAGARVLPVAARAGAVGEMTRAFNVNLTALSLLALLVGMFLIYNTMTFSVVQRRPLFGTLRCLGVTRREVFALVVSEALVIGVAGAALGVLLGVALGQAAVQLVTRTINDLFFVLTVQRVDIPAASLVKGALLGVLATAATAVPPAWEAASAPPRAALSRSGLEGKARRVTPFLAAAGALLIGAGGALLAIPTRDLFVSFAGTFAVVVGFAMLTPLITALLMRAAIPPFGRIWGALGRMAPRSVAANLSRTSIAVAALMVAVSVTIGVGLMVNSFRHTVAAWLEQTLQGDVYISATSLTATGSTTPLAPAVLDAVAAWPGVARVDALRFTAVDSPDGPINISAVDSPAYGEERLFRATTVPAADIWAAMRDGAVTVSEPFANRFGVASGGTVTLDTDRGPRAFPVVGVYYDYGSTEGTVTLALPVYRALWDDDALTALSLRLAPEADPDAVARALQDELAGVQSLLIRPNRALRADVLVVFDQTFAITAALQMLATLVAFIGVLSALLSLQLEKQRELGILRAVGLTVRQLWGLVMLETGLMGAVAGLLAMPTGFVISLILVYIINQRAFGWTLQLQVEPGAFVQALAVAVSAALLAGLYPARRMSRTVTAEALKFEV
ncbi:MAG: ABC transporter permease [Anaerolineae bacterium]|nr:ABC transporter permease [Anaerolineae bacterium]